MNYPGYTVSNLPWPPVNNPHPAALMNLKLIVDYMVQHGMTNPDNSISSYSLAVALGKDVNSFRALLKNRPGFVSVAVSDNKVKYFWLQGIFGNTYPEVFTAQHRATEVPLYLVAVREVEVGRPESSPRVGNKARNELAAQLGQKFDWDVPNSMADANLTIRVKFAPLDPYTLTWDRLLAGLRQALEAGPDKFVNVAARIGYGIQNNIITIVEGETK